MAFCLDISTNNISFTEPPLRYNKSHSLLLRPAIKKGFLGYVSDIDALRREDHWTE